MKVKTRRATVEDSDALADLLQRHSANSGLLGRNSAAVCRRRLIALQTEAKEAIFICQKGGTDIGCFGFGPVDAGWGVNTFAFDPTEFSSAVEEVRSALNERDRRVTVRAVYEARNHQVFQALGFNILGTRVWRRRALVDLPEARTLSADLQLLPLTDPSVEALKVGECLKEAHSGGIDAHIGLYTPATNDAFRAYADSLLSGREGEIIGEASFVVIDADLIVATLIATVVRQPAADAQPSALLTEFAVRPALRAQRLGTAMMSTALISLARVGFHDVILQHTMGNLVAEKVYRRYGFLSIGDPVLTAHRSDGFSDDPDIGPVSFIDDKHDG